MKINLYAFVLVAVMILLLGIAVADILTATPPTLSCLDARDTATLKSAGIKTIAVTDIICDSAECSYNITGIAKNIKIDIALSDADMIKERNRGTCALLKAKVISIDKENAGAVITRIAGGSANV